MNYNWTIIWNYRIYDSSQVDLDFIVWLLWKESFTLIVEGKVFEDVRLLRETWFIARVGDAEGGSEVAYSRNSRAEALESLIEQLSESILSKVKVA